MEDFIEIKPSDRKRKFPKKDKDQFIGNPIGDNYLKLEFERMVGMDAGQVLEFTEYQA